MKRMARFQQTLSSQASFAKYGRKSNRELFLDQMNQVVPWSELLALVEPVYPKAGNGRHPVGLAIMLRTYFLQQWFGFSDPGMEEAFYDSPVLQRFAGVDLGVAAAPDETTILRFRHARRAKTRGYRISFHRGIRLLMMPHPNPHQRLASYTPAHSCLLDPPGRHLIGFLHPYATLDKREMAYTLTCFNHHRCPFINTEHRKDSPNLIEYP
jgi:Transposase domain (DUF772)